MSRVSKIKKNLECEAASCPQRACAEPLLEERSKTRVCFCVGMCESPKTHMPPVKRTPGDLSSLDHDDSEVTTVFLDARKRSIDDCVLTLEHLHEAAIRIEQHARNTITGVSPYRHVQYLIELLGNTT